MALMSMAMALESLTAPGSGCMQPNPATQVGRKSAWKSVLIASMLCLQRQSLEAEA
jgi:hypothetical protein